MKASTTRGQAVVEFALVFPIFLVLLFAVIVIGLVIFYQQQLANAARQGARYAAISSVEAQCPTISTDSYLSPTPFSYFPCDTPAAGWPNLTAATRASIWAFPRAATHVSACWSSYHTPGDPSAYDRQPVEPDGTANVLGLCSYARVEDDPSSLACPPAATTPADDRGTSQPGNLVTVYACYTWQPPLAGVLFIPDEVVMRAVVTETIHSQQ
jgi:hypothetical protein